MLKIQKYYTKNAIMVTNLKFSSLILFEPSHDIYRITVE